MRAIRLSLANRTGDWQIFRVGRAPRNGLRCRSAGAPTAGNGTPPAAALDGGETRHGTCAALLRTAMVIFGTIGWPIKTHRDHRLRRRLGRGRSREPFRATALDGCMRSPGRTANQRHAPPRRLAGG